MGTSATPGMLPRFGGIRLSESQEGYPKPVRVPSLPRKRRSLLWPDPHDVTDSAIRCGILKLDDVWKGSKLWASNNNCLALGAIQQGDLP